MIRLVYNPNRVAVNYRDPAIARANLRHDLIDLANGADDAERQRDPLFELRGAIWPGSRQPR